MDQKWTNYQSYLVVLGLATCLALIVIDLKIKNDLIHEAKRLEAIIYGQGIQKLPDRNGSVSPDILPGHESSNHETRGLGTLVPARKESSGEFWPDAYRSAGDNDPEIQSAD